MPTQRLPLALALSMDRARPGRPPRGRKGSKRSPFKRNRPVGVPAQTVPVQTVIAQAAVPPVVTAQSVVPASVVPASPQAVTLPAPGDDLPRS